MLQDITGWGENDRGVSFTFGGDVVRQFLKKHDFSLIARAHQVREACGFIFIAIALRYSEVFRCSLHGGYQHRLGTCKIWKACAVQMNWATMAEKPFC